MCCEHECRKTGKPACEIQCVWRLKFIKRSRTPWTPFAIHYSGTQSQTMCTRSRESSSPHGLSSYGSNGDVAKRPLKIKVQIKQKPRAHTTFFYLVYFFLSALPVRSSSYCGCTKAPPVLYVCEQTPEMCRTDNVTWMNTRLKAIDIPIG